MSRQKANLAVTIENIAFGRHITNTFNLNQKFLGKIKPDKKNLVGSFYIMILLTTSFRSFP